MVDFAGAGLNRKKVFEDTYWLTYLFCGGEGIGQIEPLVISDVKELCLHSQAGTTDIVGEQGICHSASTCVCITQHFALPPAKDTYPCVICNKPFGEKRGDGALLKGAVYTNNDVFDKPFWLLYCFCEGCGVHKPLDGTLPLIASQFKEFCCAGSTVLENPVVDGVVCSQLGNFLCCWQECQMPPAEGNPKFACCTWKLNKDHSAASTKAPGAPVQMNVK